MAAISALSKARALPGYARNRTLLDRWGETGRRGQRSGLCEWLELTTSKRILT